MKVMINTLRRERGMSQQDLAEKVGVARPYLSQIERGDRRLTDVLKTRIAEALDVSPDDLVDYGSHGLEGEKLLLEAFWSLPVEQQDVWLDMARAALRRR